MHLAAKKPECFHSLSSARGPGPLRYPLRAHAIRRRKPVPQGLQIGSNPTHQASPTLRENLWITPLGRAGRPDSKSNDPVLMHAGSEEAKFSRRLTKLLLEHLTEVCGVAIAAAQRKLADSLCREGWVGQHLSKAL